MTEQSTRPRFGVGSRVRVKMENREGNPRTPQYVRGKTGVVSQVHGVIYNPIDHRGSYPPLYSVVFAVGEVFGGPSADKLSVDLHEEWLEPA
ncbi:MAG TPA: SH3-like domain-containing protein [Chloroflexota bacterium]|nr:SH3-like domain-containing protein [Chloroflexota bacterium]